MRRIRSGRWLDVATVGAGGYAVLESACLKSLVEGLPHPNKQFPQLWAFLGSAQKNKHLHDLFPATALSRADSGTIRLRGDEATVASDNPILFADGDPWNASVLPNSSLTRGDRRYNFEYHVGAPTDVIHGLYSRVLFLFADVVCIFAEDLPSGTDLAALTKHCAVDGLPLEARPHLIIVMGTSYPACPATAGSALRSEAFSAVTIFPSEATRGKLKDLLEIRSREVRQLRMQVIGQLSGVQLQAFLQSAIACLATTHNYTYNFVRASRTQGITANIGDSVRDFYQKCIAVGLPDLDAARFIASALMMDHYSPEMPLMDPKLVFRTLYRPMILAANPFPTDTLVNRIESAMVIEFPYLATYTSLDQRKRLMIAKNGHYSAVKSNRICLYCLVQAAQHFPPCDHALCDLCAQRFGSVSVDTEYQFTLGQCLLCCDTTSMIIDVLPPTMDPSILAIDGGGVRGVVPIQWLILIQEYLGECRLQDVFDLDVSTSSGGLTDLGLRALNLPIQECEAIFNRLARCLFEKRRRPAFPWLPSSILGRTRQWYAWWRHDSCYDGLVFDNILQQLYGNQSLLHSPRRDSSGSIKCGAKFGVVATSIGAKTETVMLGNFNAATGTSEDCGYQLIRPKNINHELEVWKAGRATAAVPGMFSPIDTPAGTFQDGGLTDNFAGGIARRASRTIWPNSREPARLLSLGTGSRPLSANDGLPHFRNSIVDGFFRRAFNAWMSSLDAETKWREMKSQLDESIAGNFRRLNVPLEETSSALDDPAMMDHYRDLVIRHPGSARMAKEATVDLITARFFFELDAVPQLHRVPFWCHGTIRCKGQAGPLLAALQQLVPDPLEFVTDAYRLGPIRVEKDICPSCHRFCWPVSLRCHDPAQSIQVFIKSGRYGKWRINSFPSTPTKLVKRQQLDSPFGKADHGCPVRKPCPACDSNRLPFRGRRRRRNSHLVAEHRQKRICLR